MAAEPTSTFCFSSFQQEMNWQRELSRNFSCARSDYPHSRKWNFFKIKWRRAIFWFKNNSLAAISALNINKSQKRNVKSCVLYLKFPQVDPDQQQFIRIRKCTDGVCCRHLITSIGYLHIRWLTEWRQHHYRTPVITIITYSAENAARQVASKYPRRAQSQHWAPP